MKQNELDVRRIRTLIGEDCDLDCDEQVNGILKRKFNIYLPQRRTLFEALRQTNSDHEIIDLLIRQRSTAESAGGVSAAER